MATGFVFEEIYLEHKMGVMHPESPRRLEAIREVLSEIDATKLVRIPARPASIEELRLIHTPEYIDYIVSTKGKSVMLDPDTSTSPLSYDAAAMAVGGTIKAIDAVVDGRVRNAFAFVRPPGHHAEKERAMGFCIFNNVAIGAEYAIRVKGLKKVAILDFDVHHGNGTQDAFYDRSDVLYISTHRWPFYPGTGSREEKGEGDGFGYTVNIPFSRGADDAEYKKVYSEIVFPILTEYAPDMILVSAGYDAHVDDPIGGMNLTTDGFNWITEGVLDIANKTSGGKIIFVLEGGYSTSALKESVKGALEIISADAH